MVGKLQKLLSEEIEWLEKEWIKAQNRSKKNDFIPFYIKEEYIIAGKVFQTRRIKTEIDNMIKEARI